MSIIKFVFYSVHDFRIRIKPLKVRHLTFLKREERELSGEVSHKNILK